MGLGIREWWGGDREGDIQSQMRQDDLELDTQREERTDEIYPRVTVVESGGKKRVVGSAQGRGLRGQPYPGTLLGPGVGKEVGERVVSSKHMGSQVSPDDGGWHGRGRSHCHASPVRA